MNEMMTARELAEALRLSEDHIRRLTSRKEIPYVKIGHAVRYRGDDIERWLAGKRVYCRKEINEMADTYVATRKSKGREAVRAAKTTQIF